MLGSFLNAWKLLVIHSERKQEVVIYNSFQDWGLLVWKDLQARTGPWGEKTSKAIQYGDTNI